jgi:N-carbamoylputrescine amidase
MKKKRNCRIGIIQTQCKKVKSQNIDNAIDKIKFLKKQRAEIICLPELFSTQYFCHTEDPAHFQIAEPIPGSTTEVFSGLAKELQIVLILPIFEKRAPGIYHNSIVILDEEGEINGLYRKNHIPDDPGYYEKFYFSPGDKGYEVVHTKFANIGVLICWDQWFPEAARIVALSGADIIFYPTAIGWDLDEHNESVNREQLKAWQTIQLSHAIANGLYVVAVNRTGTEQNKRFWGNSFVSNPFGTIIYQSTSDAEDSAVIDIDMEENEKYRTIWPFFRDRRIDTYHDLLKRYNDNKKDSSNT